MECEKEKAEQDWVDQRYKVGVGATCSAYKVDRLQEHPLKLAWCYSHLHVCRLLLSQPKGQGLDILIDSSAGST